MLRRLLLVGLLATIPLALFIASPFLAAWQLREAIKSGDTAYLDGKVEWENVRASLKASLAAHARLLPEVNAAGEQVKPSMWQRVKSAFGSTMLDRFVETYATAEGLPKLFQYRKTYKQVLREPLESDDDPWHQRVARFYPRVKRAEFQSPTRVEIEVADRLDGDRNYVSVLELKGFEWKLTSLRVVAAADPAR